LQENTYGYSMQWPSPAEQAQYIFWNTFAAYQELAEASVEFSWKPWAVDQPFVNRDRLRDELIDVLHFVGNALVGIGVDDDELAEHYQAKQEKNRRRAASGTYSAKKGSLGEGSDIE
jgi:NTP pyrophosphatase (non-canonical NTP hydrolase)